MLVKHGSIMFVAVPLLRSLTLGDLNTRKEAAGCWGLCVCVSSSLLQLCFVFFLPDVPAAEDRLDLSSSVVSVLKKQTVAPFCSSS